MGINQTGAGFHRDKRTKRARDRHNVERLTIEMALAPEEFVDPDDHWDQTYDAWEDA